MKTSVILWLFSVTLSLQAWGHGGVPLGPNSGRLLELSKNHSVQGELTLTNGVFRVALLDEKMKPIALGEQTLLVTGGDRNKPQKPVVSREGNYFTFPALKGSEYLLVLQFRENAQARVVTARLTYDASICSACKHPEWLCSCHEEEEAKPAAK